MNTTILTLLIAIKAVESTNGFDPKAHGNNYQISSVCVHDVNQKFGLHYRWPEDVRNDETARDIAFLYLTYYGIRWTKEYGRVPTVSDLARIYNRGYEGAKRGEGRDYARKIQAVTRRNRFNAQKRKAGRAK